MKKILTSLLTTSIIVLFISSCAPTTPSNNTTSSATPTPSPIVSPNPTNSINVANKNAVIAVYKCVQTKAPDLALAMGAYISVLESMTDANWARDSADIIKGLSRLEVYGCKL